jgi:hypothetical protein
MEKLSIPVLTIWLHALALAAGRVVPSGSGLQSRVDNGMQLESAAWKNVDYKTTKPTIGILAQHCHNCPGR